MQLDALAPMANLIVRMAVPARPADAEAMAAILSARAPETLPVPASSIRAQVGRYRVIRIGDEVVAMASLQPIGPRRYEIRSVATAPGWEGCGLGSTVVAQVKREVAARDGALACVTTNPAFFARQGFREISLDSVPPKPARDEHPVEGRRCAMEWKPSSTRREEGADELRASA